VALIGFERYIARNIPFCSSVCQVSVPVTAAGGGMSQKEVLAGKSQQNLYHSQYRHGGLCDINEHNIISF
ncbi:MAG: hypothetical protein MUE40_21345, partial [Anaerolineae bacterium]|nr:hypothetical protein [Anaerolineae bacterium]